MPRTTDQILIQLQAILPPWATPLRPLLAGIAAELALVEATGTTLAHTTTVEGAEGIWLTLLAQGYGVRRTTGEDDASLRLRLRAPEDQVTRPAILAAVNLMLAPYTETKAEMLEFWDDGYADRDGYADQTILCDQYNCFVLVLPLVGNALEGNDYADFCYADLAYLGADGEHPVYGAIVALVNRLRAAGIRFWLHISKEE